MLAPSRALRDQIAAAVGAAHASAAAVFVVMTPKDMLRDGAPADVAAVVLEEADALLRPPSKYASAEAKARRRERPAAKCLRRVLAARPDAQIVASSATVGRPLRREIDACRRRAGAPDRPAIAAVRAPPPAAAPEEAAAPRAVTAPPRLAHALAPFRDQAGDAGAAAPSDDALDALHATLATLDDGARVLVVVADGGDAGRVLDALPGAAPVSGDGAAAVLVAAAAEIRGLDLGVDAVVALGRPRTADEYLHVAGRAARAGAAGTCVTVAAYAECRVVASWATPLGVAFDRVEIY